MKSLRSIIPRHGCSSPLFSVLAVSTILAAGHSGIAADAPPAATLKAEHFDHDPGWDSFNNHLSPKSAQAVRQDFGYSATHFASDAPGEIGGRVQRSTTSASYGEKISKTLDDPLTASGTFAVTASGASAGAFFGYFDSRQPGGSGRPIGSLGLQFDFEKQGARLAVRLITAANKSCGFFVTPFTPGPAIGRPTPIKKDGARYHWTISYDPQANNGGGRFQCSVKSDSATPEEWEGKVFSADLPPGFRKEGARFDHFGLMNMMKSGGPATIYFSSLQHDGVTPDLSQDPGWAGVGNRVSFQDQEQGGAHDFGYLPTNQAGGSPGEVGGLIWRSPYAYYADRIGPLSLRDRLEARGRVVLAVGAPDSGMFLGWFSSEVKKTDDSAPLKGRNLIGVEIGGPTRVGHYFLPFCSTEAGDRATAKSGPLLKHGAPLEWTFVFDPAANEGHGQMRVTLGGESVTVDLKAGQKPDDAVFDRFGLFTVGTGGGQVKVYFDDLIYSAAKL